MSDQPRGRRVKVLRITRGLLADIFKQNQRRQVVVMEGLPGDARLVGIDEQTYFLYDQVALKFESDQWPEVPEGNHLREVELQIRAVDLAGVIGDALDGRLFHA